VNDDGWPSEEDVVAMLRAVDPVPPDVLDAAAATWAWRAAGQEVADLVADVESGERAGVRGGGRQLTFRAGAGEVLVEVAAAGRTATLTGQVVPAAAGTVAGEWPGGSASAEVDGLGRFVLTGVRTGLVRLRLAPEGGSPVVTDWVRV
jgi:hypothetical protein